VSLPASAAAFDFGVPDEFGLKDSQMYFRSAAKDSQAYLATGAYYGPIFELRHEGRWMADFLGVGGWGNAELEGQSAGSQLSASFGLVLVNFWGLQLGVAYNPVAQTLNDDFADRVLIGAGLSLTGLINQAIRPPATPANP
jgi:hypothetical protein